MVLSQRLAVRPRRLSARSHIYSGATAGRPAVDPRAARQFRRLAANVLQEFPLATGGSLLFSGVSSSCHAAKVAQGVAVELAGMTDIDVALVDVDSREYQLSEEFATHQQVGFSDVLQGRCLLSDALVATEQPNLQLLPFGDRRYGRCSAESTLVCATLSAVREVSRFAIYSGGVETSSLQAVLSRHCDGTYLVVQLGDASREDTSATANFFSRAGARLIGCVATDVF